MISATDQKGRFITLPYPAKSIISFVPSLTETLVDLKLEDELKGVTRFCVHPDHLTKQKMVVGGTKKIIPARIKSLAPDLIIANKEENTKKIVELCSEYAPIYISDIKNIEDVIRCIKDIGKLTDRVEEAQQMADNLLALFSNPITIKGKSVLYLIWENPTMAAGSDTFIDNMIHKAGYVNHIQETRYPIVDLKQIAAQVDEIWLSTEPYSFKQQDVDKYQEIYGRKVRLVDGGMFSWYGSRLFKSAEYLRKFD